MLQYTPTVHNKNLKKNFFKQTKKWKQKRHWLLIQVYIKLQLLFSKGSNIKLPANYVNQKTVLGWHICLFVFQNKGGLRKLSNYWKKSLALLADQIYPLFDNIFVVTIKYNFIFKLLNLLWNFHWVYLSQCRDKYNKI
jgi:hypothetical protein